MKTVAILVCLVYAAAAAPQGYWPGAGGFLRNSANGAASGNVATGFGGGYPGSKIVEVSSNAQGSTAGNGYSNNAATANHFSSSGIYGNMDSSQTQAISNQHSFGGGLFGGGGWPQYGGYRQQFG